MECYICLEPLDQVHAAQGTHPACEPEPGLPNQLAVDIQQELSEIIHWADLNSPRSIQTEIGPSELGTPCDRRLAYRLANNPEVNERDPWPAIVGTGVHNWMEAAVNDWQVRNQVRFRYMTEEALDIQGVLGHTDLYRDGVVVDYKTKGPSGMKEARKDGPTLGYKIQLQLYGLGHVQAGRPVTDVALVYLPRAGWLRDMYVWTDKFRPKMAERALARMRSIAAGLLQVDIVNNPTVYNLIPATADGCGFCPYFRRSGVMDTTGANERGCPGA